MEFVPEGETNYVQSSQEVLGATVGDTVPLSSDIPGETVPLSFDNPGEIAPISFQNTGDNVPFKFEHPPDSIPFSSYNPGNIIGYIEVDQLPEEYKGLTPTVKVLPIKIEKKDLQPENKSNNLPPKDEIKKLKPLFPPGTEPFVIPNF